MSQLRFYKTSVIALIILNLLLISFFFYTKPKGGPPKHDRPKNFQLEVIETLHLNEAQEKEFRRLAKEHSNMMNVINEEKSLLLKPYFEHLTNESSDSLKHSLLTKIESLEGRKTELTYKHFDDLKETLNEDQIEAFKNILEKLIDRIVMPNRKNPPHPRR